MIYLWFTDSTCTSPSSERVFFASVAACLAAGPKCHPERNPWSGPPAEVWIKSQQPFFFGVFLVQNHRSWSCSHSRIQFIFGIWDAHVWHVHLVAMYVGTVCQLHYHGGGRIKYKTSGSTCLVEFVNAPSLQMLGFVVFYGDARDPKGRLSSTADLRTLTRRIDTAHMTSILDTTSKTCKMTSLYSTSVEANTTTLPSIAWYHVIPTIVSGKKMNQLQHLCSACGPWDHADSARMGQQVTFSLDGSCATIPCPKILHPSPVVRIFDGGNGGCSGAPVRMNWWTSKLMEYAKNIQEHCLHKRWFFIFMSYFNWAQVMLKPSK